MTIEADDEASRTAYSMPWPVPKSAARASPAGTASTRRRRRGAALRRPAQALGAERDVGARHEHHQGETDLAEEGERGVAGMEHLKTRRAEDQTDGELANDDRQMRPFLQRGSGRDGDAADQRKLGEAHDGGSTSRSGMSVFSSVW